MSHRKEGRAFRHRVADLAKLDAPLDIDDPPAPQSGGVAVMASEGAMPAHSAAGANDPRDDLAAALARSEVALATSRRLFRAVFEESSLFLALLTPEGEIVEANPAVLQGSGETPGTLGGTPFAALWWGAESAERARVVESIAAAARGEPQRFEIEAEIGGRAAVLDLSIRPVQGERGIEWLVIEARDISQRRTAEDMLRQAQKMEAVGQLTGGIAHDFNNLLTIIGGNLEMLSDALLPTPRARRLVASARRGLARAEALTQQLLAFSRKQRLEPREVDANALVNEMSQALLRALGDAVTIELRLAAQLWPCFADRNQLETALLNLALNGRDAMGGAGKLTITTANAVLGRAEARAREIAAGDYVKISVIDAGCGMDEATLARAFDPFFTTKEPGKGTGLGLSMVYGFITQSRGAVAIDSAPGRGTAVHLFLPRHQAEAAP
jgi:PAS domain S-box-containing protein